MAKSRAIVFLCTLDDVWRRFGEPDFLLVCFCINSNLFVTPTLAVA